NAPAQGEVARELAQKARLDARPAGERVEARKIALGEGRILVVRETSNALGNDRTGFRSEGLELVGCQALQRERCRCLSALGEGYPPRRSACFKSAQIGSLRLAFGTNGSAKGVLRDGDGEHARRGHRAQEYGVERCLRLRGNGSEVGNDGVPRTAPGYVGHGLRVEPAIAGCRLLIDGED